MSRPRLGPKRKGLPVPVLGCERVEHGDDVPAFTVEPVGLGVAEEPGPFKLGHIGAGALAEDTDEVDMHFRPRRRRKAQGGEN